MPLPTAAVTGAMSYIGSAVATSLLARGWDVVALTNRTRPLHPEQPPLPCRPLQFSDRAALVDSLRGAKVLVNTYWVRFSHFGARFDEAVTNTRTLFAAAREAGVERVVQVSVSNASPSSLLPYYRGKAETEEQVRSSGMSWAVVRPTLVVGERDILLNNIAYLLRRFPFFAVPGDGTARVQPVTLEDTGEIVADVALAGREEIVDAAGPEVLTFEELVRAVATAVGRRARIVQLPPALALGLVAVLELFLRDVVLTRQEADGLNAEMLISHQRVRGATPFSTWLAAHGAELGRDYASEWQRHFAPLAGRPQ
jgi:uncharacterized protein YbjT (DUF2867 family)